MTIEECTIRWLIQLEKFICPIENDFIMLNEEQLEYRLHVRRCNIREIMDHLLDINTRLIQGMNQSIHLVKAYEGRQEYAPGWPGAYFLSSAGFTRCSSRGKNRNFASEGNSGAHIFSALLQQENKLKDIISLSTSLDMNKKVVPFRLSGLIKLSLAETLEYNMLCQQSHFIQARHLLRLQN